MYPEFIAIYVGLGVLAAMLLAVIVMLIMLMKKFSGQSSYKSVPIKAAPVNVMQNHPIQQSGAGVVFCKSCQNQFAANANSCPHCGTIRT